MVQQEFLNTPPMMGPPTIETRIDPNMVADPSSSVPAVQAAIATASKSEIPTIEDQESTTVELPAGWIAPNGRLYQEAVVRELTGYDEEKLSRIDPNKNVAHYVTELLSLGVEMLGDQKPSKEILRDLVVGDRDALVLGIRRATYGNDVVLKLTCTECGEDSEVTVSVTDDIKVKPLEDPLQRLFPVKLKHGEAQITLMNGWMQENFGDAFVKKTKAEMDTRILQKCVVEINGIKVLENDDAVKRLSSADRATLIDAITEHQPGPQLGEIEVPCATCGAEYPISLGLGNLFRF
jgi:hypothetical protein